jgi:histidinol-phosphate aminotransferase
MDATKFARRCILDLKDYVPGKPIEEVQRELGLQDVLKMASNENLLGQSPLALDAMVQELKQNGYYYPEGGCTRLVNALAAKFNLEPEQFVVDNGIDGVITLIGMAFIESGDEVICGRYTFPAYASITIKLGGKPVIVPNLDNYRLDIDGFIKAISPKTKLVFLCNPNNPTGTFSTTREFERLLEALPKHALLISDEAYQEFAIDSDYPQTIPYMESNPQLIILRTFSKLMGLAGVRIGYAMAHKDLARMMMKVREPFPVNRAAQAGALASLRDSNFIQQLYEGLKTLGIRAIPSQTNFILADLGKPCGDIYSRMLSMGVILRPLGPQGLPNCLRITVGTSDQNERMLKALAKALE